MVISNVSKRLCNFSKHTQTRCPKCFPESVYRYSYHHFSKGDKLDYHFMRYDGLIMVLGGDVELVINNENFTLSDGDMFVIPMLSVVSFTALTAVDIYSHTFKVERYHDCMSRKLEGYIHLHGYNSIPSVPVKLTPSLLSYIETLKFQIDNMSDCFHLYTNKSYEFGALLAYSYDSKSLADLFYPLFRVDLDLVLNLCSGIEQFVTVEDMIAWTQMRKDEFLDRFQASFNKTPEDWLEEQRVHLIRHYVTRYPSCAQELMIRFYFCSIDHLESFCKRYYQTSVNDFIKKSYRPNLIQLF